MPNVTIATSFAVPFYMVASSDHITGLAGLDFTPTTGNATAQLSKASGSFVDVVGAVVDVGFGHYLLTLDAADTDTLGNLLLRFFGAAADPTDNQEYRVVADGDDIARQLVRDVRQRLYGKVTIDRSTSLMTVYNDDGSVRKVFKIAQNGTDPNIEEVVPLP